MFREFDKTIDSLIRREIRHQIKIYKNKSWFNRIKLLFTKNRLIKTIVKENQIRFSKTWINYNKNILEAIKTIPSQDYILINISDLIKNSDQVFIRIQEWGFDLKHVPFKEVFDENLFSNAPFNKNLPIPEKIIKEAQEIESMLFQNRTTHLLKAN